MTSQVITTADAAQLLREAGCGGEFTRQFLNAMVTEGIQAQLLLLRTQRQCQLDRLHEEEKKLDRLDYLRYVLEKQLPPSDAKKRGPR